MAKIIWELLVPKARWNSSFLRTLHQSHAEEGEEAMSNESDSTVEQTKETYTVIVLNFTKREKKCLK